METFDFTAQKRRPSVSQIIAAWKRAERPYEFAVERGETWAEFRYTCHGWEDSGNGLSGVPRAPVVAALEMSVRNFYINARIDGRKTRLIGGPARKDGGFDLTITQRHEGIIQEAVTILARAKDDGTLVLKIQPSHALNVELDNDNTWNFAITSKR